MNFDSFAIVSHPTVSYEQSVCLVKTVRQAFFLGILRKLLKPQNPLKKCLNLVIMGLQSINGRDLDSN